MGAAVGQIVTVRQGDTDSVGVILAVGERDVVEVTNGIVKPTGEKQVTVDVAVLAPSLAGIDYLTKLDDDAASVVAACPVDAGERPAEPAPEPVVEQPPAPPA